MRSCKKLAAILFAIIVGALLMVAPAAAFADITHEGDVDQAVMSGQSVIDLDGLLRSDDVGDLESAAADIQSKYDVATYFVTVPSLEGYDSAVDYANDFTDEYDLESTAGNGSLLFLVCLDSSQFALISAGNVEDTFTDSTLNYLSSDISPYLGRSDWKGAAETFYSDVTQTLSGKKANATSNIAYNGTYVVDDYGLLSDSERADLEAKATSLAQQYNLGVYLLIVDYMDGLANPTSSQRTNFATSFYRANGLGIGSGKDGIMLAVAVDSRDYVTIAYGQGSYSFSNEGINTMEDHVVEYLGDNDWYGAFKTYYGDISSQLQYYDVQGEPWTEPDLISLVLKILAALGIPAGVAFGNVRREKAAMKTAREQTEASNYLVRNSFQLTKSKDRFINTTLIATPIPKHEDHDSGGGFGGGGWGGGGGGGFSSSGGGKF